MKSAFTSIEIECYRVVLHHPGCSREEVVAMTYFSDARVRKALLRLCDVGVVTREREPGSAAPYRYQAARGMEPIVEQQRIEAERRRHKQLASGEIPKARGLRRSQARGPLMSKAEWEALFVNYELAYPDQGFVIIDEHLERRARQGRPAAISYSDIPRLMAEVERRRRAGRRHKALSAEAVSWAKQRHAGGETIVALAREYGVTWDTMSKAIKRG